MPFEICQQWHSIASLIETATEVGTNWEAGTASLMSRGEHLCCECQSLFYRGEGAVAAAHQAAAQEQELA